MPVSPVARAALLSALVAAALGGSPAVAAADCSSPANAVVAENCLPGSPRGEWDVDGAGSAAIQGFATDISVNRGETVQFKVDTPARAYRLDIYRMGYYGGGGGGAGGPGPAPGAPPPPPP